MALWGPKLKKLPWPTPNKIKICTIYQIPAFLTGTQFLASLPNLLSTLLTVVLKTISSLQPKKKSTRRLRKWIYARSVSSSLSSSWWTTAFLLPQAVMLGSRTPTLRRRGTPSEGQVSGTPVVHNMENGSAVHLVSLGRRGVLGRCVGVVFPAGTVVNGTAKATALSILMEHISAINAFWCCQHPLLITPPYTSATTECPTLPSRLTLNSNKYRHNQDRHSARSQIIIYWFPDMYKLPKSATIYS